MILGKSIKTMASALDSTLGGKNIFTGENMADAGLELDRAEARYKSESSDLGIYITFYKDFKGTLKLTNYDPNGKKIDAKAGGGGVQVFSFLHSGTGLTTYYILSQAD